MQHGQLFSRSVTNVNSLRMIPVKARWTPQRPRAFMMEPMTRLDIAWNMGVKALSLGCDPIYNGAFHSFCVVSTGTISTLLNLMGIVNTDFTGEAMVDIPNLQSQ